MRRYAARSWIAASEQGGAADIGCSGPIDDCITLVMHRAVRRLPRAAAHVSARFVQITHRCGSLRTLAAEKTSFTRCQRSGVMRVLRPDLALQPGTRDRPFTLHRRRRDTDDVGSLLDAQSAEEPQLNQLALLRIQGFQPLSAASTAAKSISISSGSDGESAACGASLSRPSSTRTAARSTCGAPSPRFAAERLRAWSTRIRRINCEAMPKNCVRHSQSTCADRRSAERLHGRVPCAAACARRARDADDVARGSATPGRPAVTKPPTPLRLPRASAGEAGSPRHPACCSCGPRCRRVDCTVALDRSEPPASIFAR